MTTPFQPEDLFQFRQLDQLNCVLASDLASFVVTSVNQATDSATNELWVASVEHGSAKQFTFGVNGDYSPRWSPDGQRLAFLSARGNNFSQIQVLPLDGGEARPLSHLEEGVVAYEWSPDGRTILAAGAVSVDPEWRGERSDRAEPRAPDAPEVAWRLPYKADGMGYLLKRQIHLFAVDTATGNHSQVTRGAFDVLASCWSPDNARIAYVRTREGREAHRTDLWIADANGGNARRATEDYTSAQFPHWSPDGRWIAFLGGRKEGDPQIRLWLYEVASGKVRQLGGDLELATGDNVRWTKDSAMIAVVIAHRGCQHIASVAIPSGEVRTIVGGEVQVYGLCAASSRLAYFLEGVEFPRELWSCNWDGSDQRRLTDFNAWWRERTGVTSELRRFDVPDGRGGRETIEGWYVRPQGATGALPLLVDVHGGPTSYALLGFPWHVYWNVLCARGWSIVALNPVGSSSYGLEFARRLNGAWGELDFPQHLAAADALQKEGLADERLAIAGKSYGGYMAAWAIGHTRRFRAAIVSAPVANLESHIGTSDGGYYSDPYTMQGERFLKPERYRQLSPVQHAHDAVTPTLILQGKEDERCPRGQAEEMFAALMRGGRAQTELVMYPGGGHHFFESGKPSHRLDVVTRMVAWLQRWIDQPVEDRPVEEFSTRADGG
jgi:dipeptidyl aminopeptidase/acylaminoacyl peptidase